VLKEIRGRLDLLLGIGLDYLSFNRRSGTLSGGESQRIRLSTQIGSGLMGMLYVLDEPSIGLHPKDNVKMIATLESLRDIGNTVIVVEHDEDTIRAADHIVEMGPGPGVHGGTMVVQGTFADVLKSKASPTGQFLSGKRSIAMPKQRRRGNSKVLTVRGACENNLKNVDVAIPLGMLVAITGASGSGKSTLVNEILFKALWKRLVDTRTLPGDHDGVDGLERTRWSTSTSRQSDVTAARIRPPTSASTTRSATSSPRRRCRSSAATRLAGSASTSKAGGARNVRVKARSRRSCISCPTSRSPAARAKARVSTARRSRSRCAPRRLTMC
jgi:excinuclease ABC subunit A